MLRRLKPQAIDNGEMLTVAAHEFRACTVAVAAISESKVRRPLDFAYRFRRSYASWPMEASR